ncbi:hypothetical protein EKD04_017310 [Chloroflexales bacterium ZM16-3]|nr:hypothetical protein [Chloroflexales bacterium ZM16-3]
MTDQSQLAHLAAQAQVAQESRNQQRKVEEEGREIARRRDTVARQQEIFTDLFGPRIAAQLGLTFVWDERYRCAVGRTTVGGAERVLYYQSDRVMINDPENRSGGPTTGYYGGMVSLEEAQHVDHCRERAERLVLALAGTFPAATTDEAPS